MGVDSSAQLLIALQYMKLFLLNLDIFNVQRARNNFA
jgi:hypothetical protein